MSVLFDAENNFPETAEVAPMSPMGDFIQDAIKTAQNSTGLTREDIVEDVSQLLGCSPNDLAFMFGQDNQSAHSRSIDLPDYRLALSEVYLEAAE